MSKFLNFISSFIGIIAITLLCIFNSVVNGLYFNGCVILIILLMLINPVNNLYKTNKKIINNFIYHIMFVILYSYIIYTTINSLLIYIKYYKMLDMNLINNASNYFYDRLIYIIIAAIILLIISLIFKKKKIESKYDNSIFLILIIIVSTIIPFFSDTIGFEHIFTLSSLVFGIITFIHTKNINITNDASGYYLILELLGLLSINPIQIVLSLELFIKQDKFRLNI